MQTITMKSTLREVYAHPVGHDVIKKILLTTGIPERALTAAGGMSLRTAAKLAEKVLDAAFWETFLALINTEKDDPRELPGERKQSARQWWKEAVFYQIYPRSFADADGDGVGDLRGIIGKLDELKRFGVDAVWLSPVYDSPNDDNGYDIRDYQKILAEYGTMEEFDELLAGLHARGMRLMMDLVVNHTSDEHRWFREAVRDPKGPYHDYYLFRKNSDGSPPNNWTSFFGQGRPGDAWNYIGENDEWALHLFSKKQMDLNWDNPSVRAEVAAIVRWWLDKGVDGFRMDVINYISKRQGLPDGNAGVGELTGYTGIEHYFYGPRLHEYLRELCAESFARYGACSVGETPGIGMEMAKLLTHESRGELDMIFSFDHLETPGHTRFDDYRYDLNELKRYYIEWMTQYASRCQMTLFFENHDNPRMISKVNPDPKFRHAVGTLLAMIQLTLKGTPFLYQGQEYGAVNVLFTDLSQISDVESINLYRQFCETMSEEEAFRKILAGTRDHARAMMDWEEAAAQRRDRDSVYYFYKKLIALRKAHKALVYGDVKFVHTGRKNLFAWYRRAGGDVWYVECNLCEKRIARPKRPSAAEVIAQTRMLSAAEAGTAQTKRPFAAGGGSGAGNARFQGALTNVNKPERRWMQPYEACLYRLTGERPC